MNCKSSDAFGYVGKSEFISESSPIFNRAIRPLLEKFYNEGSEVYGAAIEIDVTNRGGRTFTAITDITITLPEKSEKKGA